MFQRRLSSSMGLWRSSTFPRYLLSLYDIGVLGTIRLHLITQDFRLQALKHPCGMESLLLTPLWWKRCDEAGSNGKYSQIETFCRSVGVWIMGYSSPWSLNFFQWNLRRANAGSYHSSPSNGCLQMPVRPHDWENNVVSQLTQGP